MKHDEFNDFCRYAMRNLSVLEAGMGGRWVELFIQLLESYRTELDTDAELVKLARASLLAELAHKIEAMPFGDTAASFAVWIRNYDGESVNVKSGD